MEIDENHKRSIETTFWMLDELLCRFERWSNRNTINSQLYSEQNNLTDSELQALKTEILALRRLLAEVKDKLELQGFVQDIAKSLQGMASVFTDNIDELEGRRMHGYGEPSKELIAYLDPKLKEFNQHLTSIAHIGAEVIKDNKDK